MPIITLLIVAIAAIACGGGTTPTVAPAYEPTFEAAECQFAIPTGHTAECGYVIVPEDRARPAGRVVRLHVAVFKSESEIASPDPVVYLEGGPGGNALELLWLTFDRYYRPFLADRDFIIFDQRGTGYSEPALDCPEYVEMVYDTLDDNLSVKAEAGRVSEAVAACRGRLESAGVNLAAYTSAENAADLNDIRRAMGYSEWNLYGISYGTRLALTAMRDFPEGIRSVILDSTYPLEVDLYETLLPNAHRAFTVLFEGCAADPTCDAAHPGLEEVFYQLFQELDDAPAALTIEHPITRERFDALLTGDRLIGLLFQALYSTEITRSLPRTVFDARAGNFHMVTIIQGILLWQLDFVSVGMHLSVQCGEEVSFSSGKALEAAADAYPRLRGVIDREPILDQCETWGAKKADRIENQPVSSDIQALVLAGEYDPITPPEWGRQVAGNLSSSFFFEFPGVGHGASLAGPCPLGIALAFLDDPEVEPRSSCIADMRGPAFSVNRHGR